MSHVATAMRTVTIFLSCPGDLLDAKNQLTAAVQEVANLFRPLGIFVSSWRHEAQALPGLGSDPQEVVTRQIPEYDIYVGLLCGRLGTPTPRALRAQLKSFLMRVVATWIPAVPISSSIFV